MSDLPHCSSPAPPAPWCWLFPPRCLVCGDNGRPGQDLCSACYQSLPWQRNACPTCALPLPTTGQCGACQQHPPLWDAAHAAFAYRFPVDRLLPRLKFHHDFAAARVLAQCMADAFAALDTPAAFIPLPLHRNRLRMRGYDQTYELARLLSKAHPLPLRTDLLMRRKATAAQSRLDAAARQRNVHDAFCLQSNALPPSHVVLFDDVMTTGATLEAASRVLRQAGVMRIDVWVCARVD
jgi:ComF family protein